MVDLCSATYAAFWHPRHASTGKVVTVRVLQETAGARTVVSHLNKATKGRLVASLLEDGANPGSRRALATTLTRLGWHVEANPHDVRTLDVVVQAT